jgi:hypothetical protein
LINWRQIPFREQSLSVFLWVVFQCGLHDVLISAAFLGSVDLQAALLAAAQAGPERLKRTVQLDLGDRLNRRSLDHGLILVLHAVLQRRADAQALAFRLCRGCWWTWCGLGRSTFQVTGTVPANLRCTWRPSPSRPVPRTPS